MVRSLQTSLVHCTTEREMRRAHEQTRCTDRQGREVQHLKDIVCPFHASVAKTELGCVKSASLQGNASER
jgi:hypothetical protein